MCSMRLQRLGGRSEYDTFMTAPACRLQVDLVNPLQSRQTGGYRVVFEPKRDCPL